MVQQQELHGHAGFKNETINSQAVANLNHLDVFLVHLIMPDISPP